ncbi:hypothetical protein HGG82_14685 [Marinomonas sp. M1K-6]|uniref:Uncharacterized protein n=1 Tax=Marinomonas profundi TaxID=2726122 RepID=A0A847R4E1_9GAMM|nr:hypothetical protein [Marinomonas profundi]NLQ18851.1 hypothetical protein [Marinomonas profundi]UDV01779.1 hypothetical protein J8N69_09150 [Marinomonas profundi]
MDIQMIVLIALSVMLVIKIVYLVFFKRPEQAAHHTHRHHSHGHHHDPRS